MTSQTLQHGLKSHRQHKLVNKPLKTILTNQSTDPSPSNLLTPPLSLQMMTAVEETGGCVPLSELVTGVTTRQCCRWVSPHTTHTSTPTTLWGGEVGYTTTPHCGGVRWGTPHNTLWGVRWGTPLHHTPLSLSALDVALDGAVNSGVRASSATLQHGTVPTDTSIPAPPLPSAPPLRLPLQMEQLQSPQEVTLEGDRQCSAVVIVTTKGLTKIGSERGRTRERT